MKKYLLVLLLSSVFVSCNISSHTLMGFYEIGYDELGIINSETIITLINTSELKELGGDGQSIMVYIFIFDDNEKLLKCHKEELSPDDMVTVNVNKLLDFPIPVSARSGVFKCIAVDANHGLVATLAGFQTKKYYKEKEVIAVSESGLFATTSKVVPDNFMKMCDALK